MKMKKLTMQVSQFKYDAETGVFTCYGNVKNNIDHAKDRAVAGVYMKTIATHAAEGTMPKMLWMHDSFGLPVGKWIEWKEDEHGLFMKGKLSKTTMGTDLEILAKDEALDSFSIGYYEIESKWNQEDKCNDLFEVDIKEVSWVNFACNEASTLESIKAGEIEDARNDALMEAVEFFGFSGDEAKTYVAQIKATSKAKSKQREPDHKNVDEVTEADIMSLFQLS